MDSSTITLTFGDCAENHRGMQIIGTKATSGYSLDDLRSVAVNFPDPVIYDLRSLLPSNYQADEAYLCVLPRGVQSVADVDALDREQCQLPWDTKALMYGRVVNKSARYNLCFSDTAQSPNYETGLGTIIAYSQVPHLDHLRQVLPGAQHLKVEGNYYHDVTKCGIGYHGDSERRKVIGVRLEHLCLCVINGIIIISLWASGLASC